MLGIITIDNIKDTFMTSGLDGFLLAHDLMEPVIVTSTPETPMSEVKELLGRYNLEYLPVVTEEHKMVGFLESRVIQRLISKKIIELQKQTDSLWTT